MFIIELTYQKSLDEMSLYLKAHRNFLDKHYALDYFIASGPKEPRDGGIILAQGDKETIAKIIQEDPFYQQDIADYRIIEFSPSKYSQIFEKVIQSPA